MFKPKRLNRIIPSNLPLSIKIKAACIEMYRKNPYISIHNLKVLLLDKLKDDIDDIDISTNDYQNIELVFKPVNVIKFINVNIIFNHI